MDLQSVLEFQFQVLLHLILLPVAAFGRLWGRLLLT
jgi:hypothetical protein